MSIYWNIWKSCKCWASLSSTPTLPNDDQRWCLFSWQWIVCVFMLTLTPERRPPHTRPDTEPGGWRCGPMQWGNEPASQHQTHRWWCWRPPACCSGLRCPCPGCFHRAGPGWGRGSWTAVSTAVRNSPEGHIWTAVSAAAYGLFKTFTHTRDNMQLWMRTPY